jgi:hypothetical protein
MHRFLAGTVLYISSGKLRRGKGWERWFGMPCKKENVKQKNEIRNKSFLQLSGRGVFFRIQC